MSWFWTIIFLIFTFSDNYNLSEAKHQRKLPAAVVVGTVYCDTCFQQDFPKPTQFISGASVAVECKETSSRPSFRQETKTDNHGEFKIHLPFSISKHLKKIKNCSVKIISTNEPFCSVAATATSSSIHLKSRKEGTHIFSAGFFSFKPLKQPQLCNQKPTTKNFKNPNRAANLSPISNPNDPTFPPPLQDPPPSDPPALGGRYLPPLPQLPNLPPLPQLPPLPGIPFLPPAKKKEKDVKASEALAKKVNQPMSFLLPPLPLLPPIPLLPPPSILPPLPFQPPPSIIPPVLPTPPSSILPPVLPLPPSTNLPPIPGLTPSPPPSAPPTFPVPLPPLPFQPTPGFPGVPPAKDSSQPKTSSP